MLFYLYHRQILLSRRVLPYFEKIVVSLLVVARCCCSSTRCDDEIVDDVDDDDVLEHLCCWCKFSAFSSSVKLKSQVSSQYKSIVFHVSFMSSFISSLISWLISSFISSVISPFIATNFHVPCSIILAPILTCSLQTSHINICSDIDVLRYKRGRYRA